MALQTPAARRLLFSVLLAGLLLPAGRAAESPAPLIAQCLKSAGADQGMALVVDSDDGSFIPEIVKAGRFSVQGCMWDAAKVQSARQAILAAGTAELASVVLVESQYLPYADNLINVLISPNWGRSPVAIAEVVRVLAPGGIAVLGNDANPSAASALENELKQAGVRDVKALSRKGWLQFIKPQNPDFGAWTHNLAGPDLSYVNDDKVAGPWSEIRWIGDPRWGALYTTYHGRVTAGGRLYYLENRGAPGGGVVTWLAARDAWNGFDLWRTTIGPPPKYGTAGPTLTCDETQVYCVEDNQTLIARDGRTGKKNREYQPGFLPRVVTATGSVLLTCDLAVSPPVASKVAALSKESGKVVWSRPGIAHPPAEDGTAFVLSKEEMEGVDVESGSSRWKVKAETAPGSPRVFCKRGVVYAAYSQPWKPIGLLVAYSAKTGAVLWKKETPPCGYGALPYADEFWMLQHEGRGDSIHATVVDALTGSVKKDFQAKGQVNNKCYPTKGSGNFLLYSNSWTLDRATGTSLAQDTVRSPCTLGQMPANGLTYYLPHHCDCQVTLRGMLAMSREGARKFLPENEKEGSPRLFATGPAPAPLTEAPDDWPMYRRDAARSNYTPVKLPAQLKLLWNEKLGNTPLTQSVAAYGVICAAEPQSHLVFGRDAVSGKELWKFHADGRTQWAPAFHKGLCIFSTSCGSVYALDAKTGREVWRLRAAPAEKYIVEDGQFASPWPVVGGVMPQNGEIFFTCGRTISCDGGMWIFAADAATGKIRWRVKGGSSGDMLLSDGKALMLTKTFYQITNGTRMQGARSSAGLLHTTSYLTPVSVLDYMACVEPSLSGQKHIELTSGRITGENLAFSDKLGVAAWRYRFGVPAELMKKDKANQRFLYAKGADGTLKWRLDENIKQQMVGMVLAGETVLMAGVPTSLSASDKSELWMLSAESGSMLQTVPLESRPVYDGLSAAGGRLYLACEDGRLMCFGNP